MRLLNLSNWFSCCCYCAGSVVLTQTHPAAPYVCRTGSITLRCQYDAVVNVLVVLWAIGNETTTANPSTIPGHTALPRTTTYQEVAVDSYVYQLVGEVSMCSSSIKWNSTEHQCVYMNLRLNVSTIRPYGCTTLRHAHVSF